MQIRRLQVTDDELFRDFRLSSLKEDPAAFGSSFEEEISKPIEVFRGWLESFSDKAVFGAFMGAQLIGCVALGREGLMKLKHKGFAWGMYVSPKFRRNGVGKQLLEAVIQFAESVEGLRQINLCVNAQKTAAIELYKSLGFEVFGTEKDAMNINETFVDEIHMTKQLSRLNSLLDADSQASRSARRYV